MNEDRICCDFMRTQLTHRCDQHPEPHDCPDVLVIYNPRFDEYGMPIRDGGASSMSMHYCPWCGKRMPDSKRDLWFETLEAMGVDAELFPSDESDRIPDDFNTDAWWRSRQ